MAMHVLDEERALKEGPSRALMTQIHEPELADLLSALSGHLFSPSPHLTPFIALLQ